VNLDLCHWQLRTRIFNLARGSFLILPPNPQKSAGWNIAA
jgi:hypothetical protein